MPIRVSDTSSCISNTLTFCGVVLLHVLVLMWAAQNLSTPESVATPPSIVGVLFAPGPEAAYQSHQSPKTQTKPVSKPESKLNSTSEPKPFAKSTAQASAEPVKQAASEVSTEATQPNAPSTPSQSSAPVQKAEPEPQEATIESKIRTNATHLYKPEPDYPLLSRRLKEEGTVTLDVFILADGSVGEVKLKKTSGFGRLDKAALDKVKVWIFDPAKVGNKAVAGWRVQPIPFTLTD